MFRFLYSLSIRCFVLAIRMAAPFNRQAHKWVTGRKGLFVSLGDFSEKAGKTIWFHAVSLGEFEQGRPLIEAVRLKYPGRKILLTFFSPSGYEVRKNYPGVDLVCYLPADTPRKMKAFAEAVNPESLFIIKYDLWFNLLRILKQRNVKIFLVSGVFREKHHFFKWWGRWFRNQLKNFEWFFVQDSTSAGLLKQAGILNVSISGDTRFDRVHRIASEDFSLRLPDNFTSGKPVIIAGSTWPQDEKLLFPVVQSLKDTVWMIAPHHVDEYRIDDIINSLNGEAVRLSKLDPSSNFRIIVVDSIGILSKLYRYATLAYIGGGFGHGIHNLPEAAVYGCPVIFGPNHKIFREAADMLDLGAGYTVNNSAEILGIVSRLLENPELLKQSSVAASNYIVSNLGATDHILEQSGY